VSHGGAREGAGRPRGRRSRKTEQRLDAIESSGLTPLDYMLTILRDIAQDQAVRLDAAKSAAPYIHPKLATTTLKGDADAPVALTLNGTDVDG
jgi:hypothetical protein